MLSRWRMQEQHSGVLGLSDVQYVFLELPKYAGGAEPEGTVDRWAYFFRETENLKVVPPALQEAPFMAALEVARTANFTQQEWDAYDLAKMAEEDARGALILARKEGREEGEAKGHAEAILRVVENRGIKLDSANRQAILEYREIALLKRLFDKALAASSPSEILAEMEEWN